MRYTTFLIAVGKMQPIVTGRTYVDSILLTHHVQLFAAEWVRLFGKRAVGGYREANHQDYKDTALDFAQWLGTQEFLRFISEGGLNADQG